MSNVNAKLTVSAGGEVTWTHSNVAQGADMRRWITDTLGFAFGDDKKIKKYVDFADIPISSTTALATVSITPATMWIDREEAYAYILYKDDITSKVNLIILDIETMILGTPVEFDTFNDPYKIMINNDGTTLVFLTEGNKIYKCDLDGGNLVEELLIGTAKSFCLTTTDIVYSSTNSSFIKMPLTTMIAENTTITEYAGYLNGAVDVVEVLCLDDEPYIFAHDRNNHALNAIFHFGKTDFNVNKQIEYTYDDYGIKEVVKFTLSYNALAASDKYKIIIATNDNLAETQLFQFDVDTLVGVVMRDKSITKDTEDPPITTAISEFSTDTQYDIAVRKTNQALDDCNGTKRAGVLG